jgi:catabolite regulation protein CreA
LFLDRADPHQGQVRAGRGRIPQAPSLFFKEMQIVRGCDVKRNVLIEDSLCS